MTWRFAQADQSITETKIQDPWRAERPRGRSNRRSYSKAHDVLRGISEVLVTTGSHRDLATNRTPGSDRSGRFAWYISRCNRTRDCRELSRASGISAREATMDTLPALPVVFSIVSARYQFRLGARIGLWLDSDRAPGRRSTRQETRPWHASGRVEARMTETETSVSRRRNGARRKEK